MEHDIVFLADKDGILLGISSPKNQYFESVSEISDKVHYFTELFDNESKLEINEKFENLLHETKISSEPLIVKMKLTQNNEFAELLFQKIADKSSALSAIAGYVNFVSQDKNIPEHYCQIDNELLSNLSIGIYRTDLEGRIVFLNKYFAEILGFNSVEELLNGNMQDLFAKNTEWAEINKNCIENRQSQTEVQLNKKNGEQIWVKYTSRIFNNQQGTNLYLDGFIEDITTKREKDIKLRELVSSRDKLFSIISHDLRSPINQFIGATEMLLEKLEEYDTGMIRKFLTLLNNEAVQSYRLLENLLQWSKNQQGLIKFDPKPIHLILLVNELMPIYQTMANAKKINIHVSVSRYIYLYADKDMVSTILRNLISNAIKFTPENGQINVAAIKKVDFSETFNEYIEFMVEDNGMGMSEDTIPKLFNMTESSLTRDTYEEVATGLGLILCKEFVEKHNGKIWVESEPEKGSKFFFTIY